MLKNQIDGKIDSWAIRWYISTFLKHKLTLYPGVSYVANIGMDDSGIHNGVSDKFDVELAKKYNEITRINIEEDLDQRKLFEKYLKSLKFDVFNKIINKIKSYL